MISTIRRILLLSLLCSATFAAESLLAVDLIGYVPHYRINETYLTGMLPQQLSLLDEVRYFGLSVNSSGGIVSLSGSVASQKNNITAIKSIIDAMPASQRPRLNITLGGADVDSVFSGVAGNSANRETLANNIAALLAETGATSVDIDWEHPDAGVERTTSYPALLKKIKEKVGPTNRVYATVDPSVMINNNVLTGDHAIDGISLMTYDLGWWGNNSPDPPHGEHSLHEYVEDAIDAWTDPVSANTQRPYVWDNAGWGNNVAEDKLGVGLPFYGRNIYNGADYTYAEILAMGTPTGNGYYQLGGQTIWIPDQAAIEARVQLAHDEGLQHIIIWEIAQDVAPSNTNSMLRIAADKLASLAPIPGNFNGDDAVDGDDLLQWQEDYGVNADSDADGDGDTDGRDFLIWQRNYMGSTPLVTPVMAIPEPNSLLLIGISFVTALACRCKCEFRFTVRSCKTSF